MALTTFEDKLWRGFVAAVAEHSPELADERFATRNGRNCNKVELGALLAALFKTRTLAQWQEILDAADTAYAPVYEREELLCDPHFLARRLMGSARNEVDLDSRSRYALFPVRFDGAQEAIHCSAPQLGAHTDTILQAVKCSQAEIRDLRRKRVVR